MSKVQIICSAPGMRRNGIAHPASAFYPSDRWSEEQLAAFRADPAFVVREVSGDEPVTTEADFEGRVRAEVERLLADRAAELQRDFDAAVAAAAQERIEALTAAHDRELTALRAEAAGATPAKKTAPTRPGKSEGQA